MRAAALLFILAVSACATSTQSGTPVQTATVSSAVAPQQTMAVFETRSLESSELKRFIEAAANETT